MSIQSIMDKQDYGKLCLHCGCELKHGFWKHKKEDSVRAWFISLCEECHKDLEVSA